jgi:hypothetical protein
MDKDTHLSGRLSFENFVEYAFGPLDIWFGQSSMPLDGSLIDRVISEEYIEPK